jgi:hypothetical protein
MRDRKRRCCGFGQFQHEPCTTIAATKRRDLNTGEPGTWRTEYKLCCEAYRVALYRRRADFDEQGHEIDRGYGHWGELDHASDEAAALQKFNESAYEQAESLHPIHVEHLAFIRRRRDLNRLFNETDKELSEGGHTGALKRSFAGKYHAALKKAKLFSKAAKGEAPPDKIAAIKREMLVEFEQEKAAAEEADHLAFMRLKQVAQEEKQPFSPSARICRKK